MKNLFFGFFVLCMMIGSYLFIDPFVAYWAQGEIRGGWRDVFQILTKVGDSVWYLIVFGVGFLIFKFWKKNDRYMFVCGFLWSSVAFTGIVADVIKWVAGRARPRMMFEHNIYGFDFFHIKHVMTSFPSGHSATAFALATALALLYPRIRFVVFFISFWVAMSRVMITAHYLSDVIAGSCIGIIGVLLLSRHSKVAPNIRYGKLSA